MPRTLSNPTVEVNDQVISIVPNSLVYKKGFGDRQVRAQSAGGDSITAVVTEDATTKLSMVKIKLLPTTENINLVSEWLDSRDGNTIRFSEDSNIESFTGMYVTTEPENTTGADGEIEIEFMGNPSL